MLDTTAADPRIDPYVAFRFLIEIDGLIKAGFSECSGLQYETEVEEVREGGLNDYVYKLPKGSKQSNLTLKRGLTDTRLLWDWYREVMRSGSAGVSIRRRTVYVVILSTDAAKRELWRWQIVGAYPVKWVGPELKADGNTVAIETLELAHHGLELQKPA